MLSRPDSPRAVLLAPIGLYDSYDTQHFQTVLKPKVFHTKGGDAHLRLEVGKSLKDVCNDKAVRYVVNLDSKIKRINRDPEHLGFFGNAVIAVSYSLLVRKTDDNRPEPIAHGVFSLEVPLGRDGRPISGNITREIADRIPSDLCNRLVPHVLGVQWQTATSDGHSWRTFRSKLIPDDNGKALEIPVHNKLSVAVMLCLPIELNDPKNDKFWTTRDFVIKPGDDRMVRIHLDDAPADASIASVSVLNFGIYAPELPR